MTVDSKVIAMIGARKKTLKEKKELLFNFISKEAPVVSRAIIEFSFRYWITEGNTYTVLKLLIEENLIIRLPNIAGDMKTSVYFAVKPSHEMEEGLEVET